MEATFYLILILLITPQPVAPIFPLLVTAITAAYSAYQVLNDAHDTYVKITTKSTNDIYDQIGDLSNRLDNVEQRISVKLDGLYKQLITELPRIIQRDAVLADLATKIARVDHWYKKFEKLYRRKKKTMNRKAYAFAKLATSDRPGHLLDMFNEIREIVLPVGTINLRDGLMALFAEEAKNSSGKVEAGNERWPCNVRFGSHGPAFPLYRTLLLTEMKGAIMVGISFVLRGLYENDNYLEEVEYEQENMIERTQAYLQGLSQSETVKQRITRDCERSTTMYLKGYDYFEFNMFQTLYLVNQKDMFDPPSCNPTCDSLDNLITRQFSCENSKCSEEEKCHGHITNCVDTFDFIYLCKPPVAPSKSYRRYEQIEGIDRYKPCSREILMLASNDSNGNDCPVCMCDCTEDDYTSVSTRIVSFKELVSDIENNYVVTGVELMQRENVTSLMIEQRQLMPLGSTKEEKKCDDDEEEVLIINWTETLENKRVVWYAESPEGSKRLEERKDYGILTVNENIINLDDILVPTHHVVTGIRFSYKKVDTGPAPIQLEVRATPCDYLSGKLLMDEENPSMWLNSEDMKGRLPDYGRNREEIFIPLNSDPRRQTGKAQWIADPNYFVSVRASKGDVDSGQLVQPLMYGGLNGQMQNSPFALGGVGLSYKAKYRYAAGFLFLRLYEFDWVSAIQFHNVEDNYDDMDEDKNESENDANQGQNEDD